MRFSNCIETFGELDKRVQCLIERLRGLMAGTSEIEKWLWRAEELITTEPKWKIKVCFYF